MEATMCTILIAEDEKIERDSLKSILKNYFKNSIRIIIAKNGREALELYESELPDIVLMDINMPKLNGLEAIEQMKQLHHHSIYLVLTSYDYFNYARDAIHLGVEDFLLKPAKPEEIIKTISHAVSSIKITRNQEATTTALLKKYAEIQPMLEQECLYAILTRSTELDIQKHLRRLNMIVKYAICIIVVAPQKEDVQMLRLKQDLCDVGYGCLYGYIQQRHVFYLMHNTQILNQDLEVIEYILAQHHVKNWPVGIGTVQSKIKDFPLSYSQAVRTIHSYGEHEYFSFSQHQREPEQIEISLGNYEEQMIIAFQRLDEEQMNKLIHELAQELLLCDIQEILKQVKILIHDLIHQLHAYVQIDIDETSLPKFVLKEEDKYQNLEVSLHYVLHALFQPISKERYQESSALAKQAIAYIQQNFRKPISLNDLAKHLSVTPFYVSKIIKSSFGKNFTDVVAEVRIEEAKHLLKDDYRVKEIAYMVGFQSQSYFAKMFKKMVGVTPSEYQELFL